MTLSRQATAATLATLALLALAAGLLLPFAGLVAPPRMCVAASGQLALLAEQAQAASVADQLRTVLAAFTDDLGRRRLQCPLPVLPATAAPKPPDLPRDRWAEHDLSMLEGCWTLTTHLFATSAHGGEDPISAWKMCFGQDGQGQQSETLQSGSQCQGPVAAAFEGERLRVTQPAHCVGPGLQMGLATLACSRSGDRLATCDGRNLSDGSIFPAQFQR